MADSLLEYLQSDMECEGLLECVYGLRQLDRECFETLLDADGPMTVDAISEVVDRERSTVYRSVQRLLQAGFVQKEQVNYDDGGYYHQYHPTDPSEIAARMQRQVDDFYGKLDDLVETFRARYGTADASGARN